MAVDVAFAAVGLEHVKREASRLDLELRAKRSAIIWCLKGEHLIVGTYGARITLKGGNKKRDLVSTRLGAPTSILLESCGRPANIEQGGCGDCLIANVPVQL